MIKYRKSDDFIFDKIKRWTADVRDIHNLLDARIGMRRLEKLLASSRLWVSRLCDLEKRELGRVARLSSFFEARNGEQTEVTLPGV